MNKREVRNARLPWVLAACLGVLLAASPALAQLDQLLKGLGGSGSRPGGLSDVQIGAGLKEALQVSTDNAVTSFHVVGEQERQIRTNPAARTTELLKDVFAKR